MEQELLPTTLEGISRSFVELEMLRTVPEKNTGTPPKDSNYRGYQMVQDPPPPYTPTLKCLIKEHGLTGRGYQELLDGGLRGQIVII